MLTYPNPVQGKAKRKLTKNALLQAIRLDIAGELDAIFIYDEHMQAADDAEIKKIICDMRDEEIAHIGELMVMLRVLDSKELELCTSPEGEVKELLGDQLVEIIRAINCSPFLPAIHIEIKNRKRISKEQNETNIVC